MGLFGGDRIYNEGPAPLSAAQMLESENEARRATSATPEEIALLKKLGISADQADQGMLDEIRKLGERGDDLSNVDQDYMNRAYQPAFERLMQDYTNMDRGVIENMNARGIAAVPGGSSEPEAYQRSLLARDTKQTLARTGLEAQNQAVQQKLQQYQARLAEPNLAATRFDQTATPYRESVVTPESTRMQTRAGLQGNIYNAKLGYQSNTNALNQDTMKSKNQNSMSMIGGGMGMLGSAMGMFSDPALKKNREPGPDPEQDLQELSETPIDRWQYRWEDDQEPMHQGAMMDEAPADTRVPGGLDIPTYLGKLTNAVKALNTKFGGYEKLMAQQGGA